MLLSCSKKNSKPDFKPCWHASQSGVPGGTDKEARDGVGFWHRLNIHVLHNNLSQTYVTRYKHSQNKWRYTPIFPPSLPKHSPHIPTHRSSHDFHIFPIFSNPVYSP